MVATKKLQAKAIDFFSYSSLGHKSEVRFTELIKGLEVLTPVVSLCFLSASSSFGSCWHSLAASFQSPLLVLPFPMSMSLPCFYILMGMG